MMSIRPPCVSLSSKASHFAWLDVPISERSGVTCGKNLWCPCTWLTIERPHMKINVVVIGLFIDICCGSKMYDTSWYPSMACEANDCIYFAILLTALKWAWFEQHSENCRGDFHDWINLVTSCVYWVCYSTNVPFCQFKFSLHSSNLMKIVTALYIDGTLTTWNLCMSNNSANCILGRVVRNADMALSRRLCKTLKFILCCWGDNSCTGSENYLLLTITCPDIF